jgi:hypothetical protein
MVTSVKRPPADGVIELMLGAGMPPLSVVSTTPRPQWSVPTAQA